MHGVEKKHYCMLSPKKGLFLTAKHQSVGSIILSDLVFERKIRNLLVRFKFVRVCFFKMYDYIRLT